MPITATSSYVHFHNDAVYSAGGPTGEVHEIDKTTGGFGRKLQEMVYVDASELAATDKTRVALRYGSHGADVDPIRRKAFVPHLCASSVSVRAERCSGRNSIYMYDVKSDNTLDLLAEVPAKRDHDAPRHNIPSPDGRFVYSVTEHTSYVDVWEVQERTLVWRQSVSIIPSTADRQSYRGDTLRLSRSGKTLFASTRGKTAATQGYVAVWSVESSGLLSVEDAADRDGARHRYRTRNSGGKANAVEPALAGTPLSDRGEEWLVLTDDEQGWVTILGWDGAELNEAARVQLLEGDMASHAVWLS